MLIRLARPNLPHLLAADRVRHTWTSYAESLRQLVLAGHAPGQLDRLTYPSTSSSATTTRPSTHPFSTRSPNATRS